MSIYISIRDWIYLGIKLGCVLLVFSLIIILLLMIAFYPSPDYRDCEYIIYGEGAHCVTSYISATRCTMDSIIEDNSNSCAAWYTRLAVLCPRANHAGCFAAVFQRCVGDNRIRFVSVPTDKCNSRRSLYI